MSQTNVLYVFKNEYLFTFINWRISVKFLFILLNNIKALYITKNFLPKIFFNKKHMTDIFKSQWYNKHNLKINFKNGLKINIKD